MLLRRKLGCRDEREVRRSTTTRGTRLKPGAHDEACAVNKMRRPSKIAQLEPEPAADPASHRNTAAGLKVRNGT